MAPATATTDLFLGLTPDRVLEAVETGGLPTRPVCYQLNAYENRVYEVELLDGSRVVAKFYRPGRWSREQILEEHHFLAQLDAAEVPVATYLEFPEGGTVRSVDGIFYGLMERRGGRAPDEIDDRLASRLGMLAGRIHAVGAGEESAHRPRLSAEHYVHHNLAWMTERGTLPGHLAGAYQAVARELAALYDRLSADTVFQRIHGDLHLGNVLERDGQLRVLDFDDMVLGPPVQDLWLALSGRDTETRRLREVYLEGYEQFRLFDRASLRLIEPLRGLRIVHYSAWLARRWHDPFFPRAFGHFGTEEYWQNELGQLDETLAAARGELAEAGADGGAGGAGAGPTEEEAELTNKDFFWDWEGD